MKTSKRLATFLVLAFFSLTACGTKSGKSDMVAEQESMQKDNLDSMTLGAGCFWCVEAIFQEIRGVHKVVSGYMGGTTENPTYKEVCSGASGHVEVARIWFYPNTISFDQLLEVFWHSHDPTTMNRQGNDVGEQYRSVIFYHNEEQRSLAEESKAKTDTSGLWSDPIVTAIEAASKFYAAEDYHQNYYANNSSQSYCSFVIGPKIAKFRKEFSHLLKK